MFDAICLSGMSTHPCRINEHGSLLATFDDPCEKPWRLQEGKGAQILYSFLIGCPWFPSSIIQKVKKTETDSSIAYLRKKLSFSFLRFLLTFFLSFLVTENKRKKNKKGFEMLIWPGSICGWMNQEWGMANRTFLLWATTFRRTTSMQITQTDVYHLFVYRSFIVQWCHAVWSMWILRWTRVIWELCPHGPFLGAVVCLFLFVEPEQAFSNEGGDGFLLLLSLSLSHSSLILHLPFDGYIWDRLIQVHWWTGGDSDSGDSGDSDDGSWQNPEQAVLIQAVCLSEHFWCETEGETDQADPIQDNQ